MHNEKNNSHCNSSINNQSVNSGNQFNIHNAGNNSPITIELKCESTNSQFAPNYSIEPVNPATLKNEKLHDLITPAILSISEIILWLTDKYFVDETPWNLIMTTIRIIIFGILVTLVVCTIIDYTNIHQLSKIGQVGYYVPKHQMLIYLFRLVVSVFSNSTPSLPLEVSRLFKNENNIIFEIKGCDCPFCKSQPIGYMRPNKRVSSSIKFVCNQNTDHFILFDYKKEEIK